MLQLSKFIANSITSKPCRVLCLGLMLSVSFSPFVFAKTSRTAKDKSENQGRLVERPAVRNFLNDMYVKHGFNSWELKQLFKTLSPDPKVIQAISKPFEEVSWAKYKERFVNDERARNGVEFWRQNEKILKKAEADFGVPAEIIVAIIGVETRYGKNTGSFPVLQTLYTLAFNYPPRASFFRGELEQYLLMTREQKIDPKTLYGSYAGAIGIPQFIPSSYRRYAVNYAGKEQIDLNNMVDAIGSVANYFKSHGWEPGQPVAYEASVYGAEYQRLINKDPQPKLPLAELAQFNVVPKDKKIDTRNNQKLAAFIILNNDGDKVEHWLTLNNFYVITRYNHSVNYAMAVYLLSQRIRALHSQG
jgi:membrane-bound lytic murein transglycosylase B